MASSFSLSFVADLHSLQPSGLCPARLTTSDAVLGRPALPTAGCINHTVRLGRCTSSSACEHLRTPTSMCDVFIEPSDLVQHGNFKSTLMFLPRPTFSCVFLCIEHLFLLPDHNRLAFHPCIAAPPSHLTCRGPAHSSQASQKCILAFYTFAFSFSCSSFAYYCLSTSCSLLSSEPCGARTVCPRLLASLS